MYFGLILYPSISFSSGFKSLYMSVKSKLSWKDFSTFKDFECYAPPFVFQSVQNKVKIPTENYFITSKRQHFFKNSFKKSWIVFVWGIDVADCQDFKNNNVSSFFITKLFQDFKGKIVVKKNSDTCFVACRAAK